MYARLASFDLMKQKMYGMLFMRRIQTFPQTQRRAATSQLVETGLRDIIKQAVHQVIVARVRGPEKQARERFQKSWPRLAAYVVHQAVLCTLR